MYKQKLLLRAVALKMSANILAITPETSHSVLHSVDSWQALCKLLLMAYCLFCWHYYVQSPTQQKVYLFLLTPEPSQSVLHSVDSCQALCKLLLMVYRHFYLARQKIVSQQDHLKHV